MPFANVKPGGGTGWGWWGFSSAAAIDMPVMRAPSEPSYPPIHEPIDPPENPDVPVREPDPEEPNEI
jgi:hypothetical protein